jgi:cyclohexyl-isocyanide hydratase
VIHGRRFSGGGISSSIDLALELTNLRSGPTASMTAQLSVQYAPDPPFASGDPGQAPPEVTAAVRRSQEGFTAAIRKSVEQIINGA